MTIDQLLEQCLRHVKLSSRSSAKFDVATAALSEAWQIPNLVIKALGAPKNYGNRISEGTGTRPDALLLVADGEVDPEGVRRAYVGRATERVPTLLVVREPDACRPVLVLTGGPNPFPWAADVVELAREAESLDLDVDALVVRILAADGASPDVGMTTLTEIADHPRVTLKKVTGAKNLLNRVREALGKRPVALLVSCPADLQERLTTELQQHHAKVPAMFIAVDDGTRLEIHRIARPVTYELPKEPPMTAADDAPSYQVNATVKDLNRYLPFDADAKYLYEEHVNTRNPPEFDTAALDFIRSLIADSTVSMVVLTGNAGHGKTHLCRRLLTAGGADDAMGTMRDDLLGETLVDLPGAERGIRILKDLSEISHEVAAERLEALLADTASLAVVCANEGRLRHVVSMRPGLRVLVDTLEAGIQDGATSIEPRVHVVNLNYQAVTPLDRPSFLDFALDHWLSHGNRWRKCQTCIASDACPIVANRTALSSSPDMRKKSGPVRQALAHLVRLAEQSGYVLTIREGLIFVAYLITGGLDCEGVHQRHRLGDMGGHGYMDSLFSRQLAPNELAQLGVLERIRRFDPGRTAIRSIDERLHRELETEGGLGQALLEVGTRPPSTRDQLRREQDEHRERIRTARRADYFRPHEHGNAELSRRLGLQHHQDFLELQMRSISDSRMLEILERLVAGLHVVQGIRISGAGTGVLFLVDPAFSRSANRSAVIAHQFNQRALELVGEAQHWGETPGEPQLLNAVDWLDRRVVLSHRRAGSATPSLVLDFDLLQFEFVMRAADGIVFQEFNAAERKRIVSRLAALAEANRSADDDDIRVMEGGSLRTLILERDNSFRVAAR